MNQNTNLSDVERAVSAGLGVVFVQRALARRGWNGLPLGRLLLGAAGAELIRRGVSGYCLATDLLGRPSRPLRTTRRAPRWLGAPGTETDPVDRDAADSFPASDPPGWVSSAGPRSTTLQG